ncbi:MAG: SUMF1/EgtB/PvdO family nonheme iron enzyme [Immundisolibacterales bacterium]|nr:SUMF1/EgtB/PvdO family nonheme iron enzyme [Immundisolibacterales bacterium]
MAVIIGNANYEHRDVPDVTFAHRDAGALRRYVVDVLGFDPVNVIDLRDATRRELFDALGTKSDPRSLLWSYLDPDGGSDVVVFYSGHGVPGLNDGRGYLLPVDADPRAAEDDGYPIDLLYRNVGGLAEAGSVRVYIDACFSGGSHGGGLIRNASPVFVEATLPEGVGHKVTSLTAASGTQIASWDENARHGLFTHHLLDALHGRGDADGDAKVTAAEAKRYLDRHMTRAARRQHRRVQQASLIGVQDAVLATAAAGGAFPARPGSEAPAETVAVPTKDDGPEKKTAAAIEAPSSSAETAESVEATLGLTFAERVLVQHGLTSLGEDVGRADGVFGRRTRAGILSYQKEKGLPETGHLTAELRDALVAHGQAYAMKRRQEEADRRADDEAYAEARRLNTLASYRAYLERGGRHEGEARTRLAEVSKPKWPAGQDLRECDDCPKMVVVPAGSFEMGSPSWEEGRFHDEGPVRLVSIAQPFAVGVHEVTFREWDACRRDGGCSHHPDDQGWGRGDRPVMNVSWHDAREYVRWLSRKTDAQYRLLSESEWEYAARAGSTTPFHFGSTVSPEQANYNGSFAYGSGRTGRFGGRTEPVGSHTANAFGLRDVHGNVWEWVEDCWHDSYRGAPSDGGAWTRDGDGDCDYRVLRGGSWVSRPGSLRSAVRGRSGSVHRNHFNGFRVARTLD